MTPVIPSLRRLTILLAALAMFGPFSIDTLFPAFPHLARQLAVDEAAIQQTVSVYLLSYGMMSLAHGPLSDAWGRKPVIIGGLVVFTLASIGCALAKELPTLLLFRALQGLSAGVGMIVGRAIIRDLYQGAQAQRLMSQVMMIFGIAPAIAPIIGGWILLAGFDWPVIFWFLVVFSLLLLLSSALWLPETHSLALRTPLVPRALLRNYLHISLNRRFVWLALSSGFSFGGIFLYIAAAPAFVMQHLRLGEGSFAWLFIPVIGGMVIGMFLSGRMAGHLSATTQIILGFVCCGLGASANITYAGSVTQLNVPWAVLPVGLCSLGVALIFPVLTLAVLDLYPKQRGLAASLQSFVQLMTNALVAGLLAPLLQAKPLHLALGTATLLLLGFVCWLSPQLKSTA